MPVPRRSTGPEDGRVIADAPDALVDFHTGKDGLLLVGELEVALAGDLVVALLGLT